MPPLALEIATNPQGQAGQLHWIESVLVYVGGLLIGTLAMAIVGLVVFWIARGRTRQTLLIALVGHDGGPGEVSFDPKMTPRLSECVALVDRRNAVFPRGSDFPMQVGRTGFRDDWDALDDATQALEDEIDTESKLGQGVSYLASSTAKDARERLESLRRIAVDDGRAWAPA